MLYDSGARAVSERYSCDTKGSCESWDLLMLADYLTSNRGSIGAWIRNIDA